MSAVIRMLFICLLALTVPAQNVAAVTMALCASGHHSAAEAAGATPVATAKHHHQAGTSAAGRNHHHAIADTAPTVDGATAASDQAASQSQPNPAQHKCSVCASCCSAAAVFDTVAAVPQVDMADAVFDDLVASVAPFAADGPDRPPRTILV